MQHFALTLTPDGQVTLPSKACDALGVSPGEQLSLIVDDDGRVTLAKQDSLYSLRSIARRARANAGPRSPSVDPIGDYLLAEDVRSKSDQ